jgi:hypothetical protein
MSRTLTSSAVDRGFDPWSGQFKDYKIGICCFSAKHCSIKVEKEPGTFGIKQQSPTHSIKTWISLFYLQL